MNELRGSAQRVRVTDWADRRLAGVACWTRYTITPIITSTTPAQIQYVTRWTFRKASMRGPYLIPMTMTMPAQIAVDTATLAANTGYLTLKTPAATVIGTLKPRIYRPKMIANTP